MIVVDVFPWKVLELLSLVFFRQQHVTILEAILLMIHGVMKSSRELVHSQYIFSLYNELNDTDSFMKLK